MMERDNDAAFARRMLKDVMTASYALEYKALMFKKGNDAFWVYAFRHICDFA